MQKFVFKTHSIALLFVALLACLTKQASAQLSELPEVQKHQVLARIQTVQSAIDTLQASFVEERQLAGLKKPLAFEGNLYLNRQGLLFLTYHKPVKHILRVKDDTVLFYVADNKTADQIHLSAMQNGAPRPDFFQLDIKNFNGTVQEDEKGYYLEQGAEDRKVIVMLDKKSLLARDIEIKSESGDITKIFIVDPVVNEPLPDSVNNFRLPEDTKINVMGR